VRTKGEAVKTSRDHEGNVGNKEEVARTEGKEHQIESFVVETGDCLVTQTQGVWRLRLRLGVILANGIEVGGLCCTE